MLPDEKQFPPRTPRQNRALHLYFTHIADTLNAAGLDMRSKVLHPDIEIPWSPKSVKEYLWRPVQKVYLEKVSTTEMTTKDIDAIFDIVNRYLGSHGIHVPFPSIEEILSLERVWDITTNPHSI